MREIKFRAWNTETSKMIDLYKTTPLALDANLKCDGIFIPFRDEWPIMQFTGLKDKNGVDIYEGDICRILYTDWPSNTEPNISLDDYLKSISHVGEISYQAPTFGILLKNRYDEYSLNTLNYGYHGRIEVIGNIHEHPHLINQLNITAKS